MGTASEPAGNAQVLGGFFRLVELDAADAARHPDAWRRIRDGSINGILVHGVFSEEECAVIAARLERHDPPFLKTLFPAPFHAYFYGRNVNLAAPGLPDYFAEARQFRRDLADLAPGDQDFEMRITALMTALDGGRPFMAAPGPESDTRYMFTTLRAHETGGFIPLHCDNELALRPGCAHLRTVVRPHIYSFVVGLARPDGGGALEVFDRRFDPLARQVMSDDRAPARPDVANSRSVAFRLSPGSMIIVDSGQHLHRVTPVEGARTRWTACSFMAEAREADATYCWG